jgi:hypothetical protein
VVVSHQDYFAEATQHANGCAVSWQRDNERGTSASSGLDDGRWEESEPESESDVEIEMKESLAGDTETIQGKSARQRRRTSQQSKAGVRYTRDGITFSIPVSLHMRICKSNGSYLVREPVHSH